MAKKAVVKKPVHKPAPVDVQERWAEAVEAEAAAFKNAALGGQLERVAHFRALSELSDAHAACEAATKPEDSSAA